jgi:molybdate transport system ATP-binding protein
MNQPIVHIQNLNVQYQQKLVLMDLSWNILSGDNWLLSGKSGSGKTSLGKAIAGLIDVEGDIKINFDSASNLPAQVLYVESWYQFKNIEGVANFYYQQRYTSLQANETVTVFTELLNYAKDHNLNIADVDLILQALGFSALKNTQLIALSSGEHKKLQLVKALWLKPQLLILDNPYTGLDSKSRANLNTLLNQVSENGVQLILIATIDELPICINRFATLNNGKISTSNTPHPIPFSKENSKKEIPDFLRQSPDYSSSLIARLEM